MLSDSRKDGKMNYKKPWHRLNIDISNAVRKDFDFEKLYQDKMPEFISAPGGIWCSLPEDVDMSDNKIVMNNCFLIDQLFSQEWLNYMRGINLHVQSVTIFYRKPYYIHPTAHIDLSRSGSPSIFGINWVLDPMDDSEMIWYDVPVNVSEISYSPADTPYQNYELDSVKDHVLDQCCIGHCPTLVNVGIPHNVIVKSRARWAISVRLIPGLTNSWQNTVDYFKPFIEN
jgi:hypothetical protein